MLLLFEVVRRSGCLDQLELGVDVVLLLFDGLLQGGHVFVLDFDVGGDAGRAHSSVVPGSRARTDPVTGEFLHEDVWKYLFTHPVNATGDPVDPDSDCLKDQRSQLSK